MAFGSWPKKPTVTPRRDPPKTQSDNRTFNEDPSWQPATKAAARSILSGDFVMIFDRHAGPGSWTGSPKAELGSDEESGRGYVRLSAGAPKSETKGQIEGYSIRLPDEIERAASGKRVEVMIYARAANGIGTAQFAAAYSTSEVGNSGWQRFEAGSKPRTFSFKYDVGRMIDGHGDFVGLLPNVEGRTGIDVFEVAVRVINRL